MLRLPIGATVLCRDGIAGRLKYVVIDPDDTEITDLIVERGFLRHKDIHYLCTFNHFAHTCRFAYRHRVENRVKLRHFSSTPDTS